MNDSHPRLFAANGGMTGRGYLVLLSAQAAGEAIHAMTGVPLSGPIIGMVLLLAVFWVRRGPSRELRASANGLLGYLSLLFVPAAVGIMPVLPLLRSQWLPIAVALAASSIMAMAGTALVAQAMSPRKKASAQHLLAAEPLPLAEGGR